MIRRKSLHLSLVFATAALLPSCELLNGLEPKTLLDQRLPLTESEIAKGLKEALGLGIEDAVRQLSADGGYWNDPTVAIPWPEESQGVKEALQKVGFRNKVETFEKQMNDAASRASEEASSLFMDALSQMTVADARGILTGPENAATAYLRERTEGKLRVQFEPIVEQAMQQTGVLVVWETLAEKYNSLPTGRPVPTNLVDYVTERAMDGIYVKVAEKERAIRTEPQARVTDLLKRVFAE